MVPQWHRLKGEVRIPGAGFPGLQAGGAGPVWLTFLMSSGHVIVTFGLAVWLGGLAAASAQSPGWSQFPGAPANTSPRHDDIHFVSYTHGWAARATDGIYRTTNSGATFEKVLAAAIPYPGTNLVAHFRSIGFASPTRGWAGNLGPGSYDTSVTDTNVLYETFDGGLTWSRVEAIQGSGIAGLCALQVLDGQHIFGGGRVRGPAHFLKSTDGGATWLVTNLTAAGVMGGIMDVHFRDPLNGFLVGMSTNSYAVNCGSPYFGRIVRTTDGGATWQPVADPPVSCSYFWKMAWPSTNVGYATLQQNAAHNTVIFYKTTDGGATWSSNGIPLAAIGAPSFFLQGVGFVNELEGWMGGPTTVAAPFNFIRTTDGGLTWQPVGYDNTQSINKIRFLDAGFGYASGRKLHVYRVPLAITVPPADQTVLPGGTALFSVTAQGLGPLAYQWRRNGTPVPGATNAVFALTNAQPADAGAFGVVVSDVSGSVTSSPAVLSVAWPFQEDFQTYPNPVTITTPGVTNGWRIIFDAASGPVDFAATFGFDYGTVTNPAPIPPAPNSADGPTRGLRLTVNKDATAAIAAVNLYPTNAVFGGDFALNFDLWLNWGSGTVGTEHALFGILHSGTRTNRPGVSPSDGVFFALSADGGVSAASGTIRDYAVFQGRPGQTPLLLTTNNTAFGPLPPLGAQFDGSDAGLTNLFPPRFIPGWGTTPAGSAGLQWLRVEVRRTGERITWALNDTPIAQFNNPSGFTNGTVMIGYLDQFSSIGDSRSFAVVDNLRVEPLSPPELALLAPRRQGNDFAFEFVTEPFAPHTVEWTTNLAAPVWSVWTNVIGSGVPQPVVVPLGDAGERYFRVRRQ